MIQPAPHVGGTTVPFSVCNEEQQQTDHFGSQNNHNGHTLSFPRKGLSYYPGLVSFITGRPHLQAGLDVALYGSENEGSLDAIDVTHGAGSTH